MKRKLIKRNKQKISKQFRRYGNLFRVFRSLTADEHIIFYPHRYIEVEGYQNAFRLFDDDWIWIPLEISSKNKRSRIQKKVYAYGCCFDIDEFNTKYGTNLKMSDIPIENDNEPA